MNHTIERFYMNNFKYFVIFLKIVNSSNKYDKKKCIFLELLQIRLVDYIVDSIGQLNDMIDSGGAEISRNAVISSG